MPDSCDKYGKKRLLPDSPCREQEERPLPEAERKGSCRMALPGMGRSAARQRRREKIRKRDRAGNRETGLSGEADSMLREWDQLPRWMRNQEVREYYDILAQKRLSLKLKRIFDIAAAGMLLGLLAVPMAVIAVWISVDSPGGAFYRQERVTAYGKRFMICKFRTMARGADKEGMQITLAGDKRVTRPGEFLRKYRLDELPQLFNVLEGSMTFVGTRPEVPEYVRAYTKEMRATLLLPAGITSEASIRYRGEAELLGRNPGEDADRIYREQVLLDKMRYNLESLRKFGIGNDLRTMVRTVAAVAMFAFQE